MCGAKSPSTFARLVPLPLNYNHLVLCMILYNNFVFPEGNPGTVENDENLYMYFVLMFNALDVLGLRMNPNVDVRFYTLRDTKYDTDLSISTHLSMDPVNYPELPLSSYMITYCIIGDPDPVLDTFYEVYNSELIHVMTFTKEYLTELNVLGEAQLALVVKHLDKPLHVYHVTDEHAATDLVSNYLKITNKLTRESLSVVK